MTMTGLLLLYFLKKRRQASLFIINKWGLSSKYKNVILRAKNRKEFSQPQQMLKLGKQKRWQANKQMPTEKLKLKKTKTKKFKCKA